MFAPLSEHVEIQLDKAFCKEFRVWGTFDKPNEWEEYKEAFASWMVKEFTNDEASPPRHPFKRPWDEDGNDAE